MASWDRQPKEPKAAYGHFTLHRDSGPQRHLRKTSEAVGISYLTIQQESATWNWTSRADQWDAHLDAISRKAYQTEAEKQAKLRAQAHSALLGKALSLLKDVDAARLGEIATAMKTATDGMRTEAGLANTRVELEVTDASSDPEAIERAKDRLAGLLLRSRPARGDTGAATGGPGGSAGADRAGVPAVH